MPPPFTVHNQENFVYKGFLHLTKLFGKEVPWSCILKEVSKKSRKYHDSVFWVQYPKIQALKVDGNEK